MKSNSQTVKVARQNKCIGDDTKAAPRQSLNCIKKKNKIKYGEKQFSIWRMEFLHPAMWHVALESWQWIHQVAAPCNVIRGSGMTYWNSTSGLHFHTSPQSMSFCTSLQNFIQIGPPSAEKEWRHVDFQSPPSWILGGPIMGSLKSPCTTSYRSSIDIIALNFLVFEKNRVYFAFWRQRDKQTDEQMNSTDALSRSRWAAA